MNVDQDNKETTENHLKLAREFNIPPASAFKTFDPNTLPEHWSAGFYGSRRTGKTTAMRDIIFKTRKRYQRVFVFSLTAHLYSEPGFDYDFVPKTNFIYGLDEKRMQELLDIREAEIIKKRLAKDEKSVEKWLFILDDIISDSRIKHSDILNSLYTQGRHFFINVATLTQHATGIPPAIRRNLDFALIFYPESQESREIIAKEYLSIFHWKIGQEVMKLVTDEPFVALVWMKDNMARKYEDNVFKYKCDTDDKGRPVHHNFKIGKDTKLAERGGPNKKAKEYVSGTGVPFNIKSSGTEKVVGLGKVL